MRVLHVGSGFRPWRRGGLVAYIEDLMAEQVRRGDEVAYFFSGRQYPHLREPRLKRWSREEVALYEVLNSPIYDHGRQPRLETDEPRVDRLFAEVVREFRPDVVHVQEVASVPTSVVDVAHALAVPCVVTLQDYFWLCPSFKLIDADGRPCERRETCGAACTAAEERGPGVLFEATTTYELERMGLLQGVPADVRDRLARRVAATVGAHVKRRRGPQGDTADYRRRREVNVRRLSAAERVVGMSRRVSELHVDLGVDPRGVRTVHLTLDHIAKLRPRTAQLGDGVTFGTLAAFESVSKGGRLLLDAVRLLSEERPGARFRVVVFGWIRPEFARAAAELPAFDLRSTFAPAELDGLLEEIDVGLIPSVWEEAYAFAGVEFLAKGIPVIANDIGGMPDYVEPGRTGWLNRSRTPEELAAIMADVIDHPQQVLDLNAGLRDDPPAAVKTFATHGEEMAAIYAEAVAERSTA